jgi:hypothetical protein
MFVVNINVCNTFYISMQCVCVCATVLTCVKCHYIYILELNMYLLVTYLPGSVASQGAIDLVAPKLLAINNKMKK